MTRQEMEARRLKAIPDLENGTSVLEIARRLNVSRISVYRWKHARENGQTLKLRKASGQPARMTSAQADIARKLYEIGPRILRGIDSNRWTQGSFAQVLKEQLGLEYDPDHVGRIMHKLGLTKKRERKGAT